MYNKFVFIHEDKLNTKLWFKNDLNTLTNWYYFYKNKGKNTLISFNDK